MKVPMTLEHAAHVIELREQARLESRETLRALEILSDEKPRCVDCDTLLGTDYEPFIQGLASANILRKTPVRMCHVGICFACLDKLPYVDMETFLSTQCEHTDYEVHATYE